MNAELVAIIADVLLHHYPKPRNSDDCLCCAPLPLDTSMRQHMAERIAARLGIERIEEGSATRMMDGHWRCMRLPQSNARNSVAAYRVRALERAEETSSPHEPDSALPPFPTLENIEWTDDELIEIGRRFVEYAKTHPEVML